METERPWLRVDIEFFAALPWGAPSPLPPKATWRRFLAEVAGKVSPLMPVHQVEFNDGTAVLGGCGEPAAQAHCSADGELHLSSVELAGWQPILLARQWDNPDRAPDPYPEEQLAALAGRVRGAIDRWGESLKVLLPSNTSQTEPRR